MPPPAVRDSARRALLFVVAGFSLVTIFFTGVFPPFRNPNELSRFQAVIAMAEYKTFAIDRPIATLGNHEDKAQSQGRYYSNKAPGLAFAALPVYEVLRLFLPPPSFGTGNAIFYCLRLLTVSLLCLLALARFGIRLGQLSGDERIAPIVTLAVAFGTPFLFYARSFFAHAWTAALLFLSWDLVRASEGPMRSSRAALFAAAAGLLAGWATISEYTVAPIAFFLLVRAAAGRSWKALLPFAAGAAVPISMLLLYQAICFGSPFLPSYAREAYPAYAELARRKLFGLGFPSPQVAWNYLFHPARGVLLFSPFLLWSLIGLVRWWRSGHERRDCLFAFASTLSFFLLLAGYPNWHGGWSLGSRYLLPALFFIALAIGHSLATPLSRGLFIAAVVYSVASHLLLTLTWTHFPIDLPWPAATGSAWFLSRGWVAENLLSSLWAGLAVALVVALATLAVPLALAIDAAPPSRPRTPIAFLIGLAPLIGLLWHSPEPPYGGRLWRASVLGAFSGKDLSREELRSVVREASTPEERKRAAWAWRIYGRAP